MLPDVREYIDRLEIGGHSIGEDHDDDPGPPRQRRCQLELVTLKLGGSSRVLIIWERPTLETEAAVSYKGFRFPVEIISHGSRAAG